MTSFAQRVVRPIRMADLESLVRMAQALGPGMTTLPADATALERKIVNSVQTFAGLPAEDPQYILAMEDMESGELVGIAGLYPRVGDAYGFYSYKLTRLVQRSKDLGRKVELELLTLSNDYTGATEVGTLAILPSLRGSSAGRMLARSRYMLIAAFPQLFADRVMAEMRGWQEEDGRCPFWDAIGARFFDMPFAEADRLSAVQGAGFIHDLMPKQPIYTALLPPDARAAIGRAHRVSAKAMSMLMDEDFRYEAHIDVFDGGPQVHAARDKIRTVQDNQVRRLGRVTSQEQRPLLVSTQSLEHFRVIETLGAVADDRVQLNSAAYGALLVSGLDEVRVAPGREPRSASPLSA